MREGEKHYCFGVGGNNKSTRTAGDPIWQKKKRKNYRIINVMSCNVLYAGKFTGRSLVIRIASFSGRKSCKKFFI